MPTDAKVEEAREKWDKLDRKRAFYREAVKNWPDGSGLQKDAEEKLVQTEKDINQLFKDLDG